MSTIKTIKVGEVHYDLLPKYIQDAEGNIKTWADILELANLGKLELHTVSKLPEASAETMNAIYLVQHSLSVDKEHYNEYITLRSGEEGSYTYSWEHLGTPNISFEVNENELLDISFI